MTVEGGPKNPLALRQRLRDRRGFREGDDTKDPFPKESATIIERLINMEKRWTAQMIKNFAENR